MYIYKIWTLSSKEQHKIHKQYNKNKDKKKHILITKTTPKIM